MIVSLSAHFISDIVLFLQIFSMSSGNGFQSRSTYCSSTSQGHLWIHFVFNLLGWLRVIFSDRGGNNSFDMFRFRSMTSFVCKGRRDLSSPSGIEFDRIVKGLTVIGIKVIEKHGFWCVSEICVRLPELTRNLLCSV